MEDTDGFDVISLANVDANILGIVMEWCKKRGEGEILKNNSKSGMLNLLRYSS